jgi:hypothetical protein
MILKPIGSLILGCLLLLPVAATAQTGVPDGTLNYVVGGKMIGGFALLAYPADYGNSGVTTFLVNHQGTVFEKDLGPRTGGLVRKINSFNPDKTWKKSDVPSPAR